MNTYKNKKQNQIASFRSDDESLSIIKMKRVGSIKQALRPGLKSTNSSASDVANNNESKMSSNGVSILGNTGPSQITSGQLKPDFHLPKSISSFLKKGSSTLTRQKKDKQVRLRH